MKLSKILKGGIFIGLVILGIINVSKLSFLRKKEKIQNQLETVKKRDLIKRVTIGGHIVPKRMTVITAPFEGYVKKLYVKLGETVNENDPIVSVVQSLRSFDPVYPIRAPYKGVVVSVNKSEGEYVGKNLNSGDEGIIRIDDTESFYIISNIPEIDYTQININQSAVVKVNAIMNKRYKGKVEEISLAPKKTESWRDEGNIFYPVKVKILNPDKSVKSGMSVIIDIITQKKEKVLSLPHEFVFKRNSHYYIITENQKEIEVRVGFQNEEYFEILEGLKEGDKVRKIDFMNILSGQAS